MSDSIMNKWRRAYATLARGRGSLGKAIEIDLPEMPVSESPDADPRPSLAYVRMHEELSNFVSPGVARRVLDDCLEAVAADRIEAGTFDLRSILVDQLPKRLAVHLTGDHLSEALDALDRVVAEIHLPPRIKDA